MCICRVLFTGHDSVPQRPGRPGAGRVFQGVGQGGTGRRVRRRLLESRAVVDQLQHALEAGVLDSQAAVADQRIGIGGIP